MDLFGHKRIAALEHEIADLLKANADLRAALHELDQTIFNLSQQPTFERMQPFITKLCEKANVRMVAESTRISNLLTSELERAYDSGGSNPR